MTNEADVHFELYRHLQNTVDEGAEFHGRQFTNVSPEHDVDSGYADVAVEADGAPFLVVEAKKRPADEPNRDVDPYSPAVIEQAFSYAGTLGAPYFATYNGERLVVFQTFEGGTHLLDRKTRAYNIHDIGEFAPHLLEAVAGIDADVVEWDPHHRAFVKRLQTYHGRLSSEFRLALEDRLGDSEFRAEYETWVAEQGWTSRYEEAPDRVDRNFAAQAAYLLMNKLVFYKLLEDAEVYDVPDVDLEELVDPDARRTLFERVIDVVDFEAVYEQDDIYDSLRLTPKAETETRELLGELERYNLDRIDHDVLGEIYEEIIPPEERYELGQFYTPPEVVDLITRLTVRSPEDVVLDPGCGSGGFLVNAYGRVEDLRDGADLPTTHQEILDRIYGIDVNRFPAHLSAINLALRDLDSPTRETNVFVRDFFDVRPQDEQIVAGEAAGREGPEETLDVPREVDAVVGNPPYVRHEEIADKAKCREHLERVGATLNEQSDLFTYFFTHSLEFLKDGGRLGFITSNQWLRVRYGEGLQQFLLDNFKIDAVINPRQRVFEGQLVPTCITVLERCDDEEERDGNLVNFVQVKEAVEAEEMIETVRAQHPVDKVVSERGFRVTSKRQSSLRDDSKWSRYLFAPTEYWELVSHPDLVEFSELGTVNRGTKTGANSFFYVTGEDAAEYGIENRFLTPTLRSVRQLDGVLFESTETEYYVLDCHEFVADVYDEIKDVDPEVRNEIRDRESVYRDSQDGQPRSLTEAEVSVMATFDQRGYEGTYEYLLLGLDRGIYARSSCSGRRLWFDLGELRLSRLVSPQAVRGSPFFPLLSEPTSISNRFLSLNVSRAADVKVVAGFLNSSFGKMLYELHGRTQRGGLVELTTHEIPDLPILDPERLSGSERERIVEAFDAVVDVGAHEDEAAAEMTELDRAVLAPFGLEDRTAEIAAVTSELTRARRSEEEYEVPVELDDREKTVDISGAERIEDGGQSTFESF